MLSEQGVRASILVADDEPGLRQLIGTVLEQAGYTVVMARDGHDAMEEFFAHHPDLVVLDVLMPRLDGWRVLERIREVAPVPVLMLTALSDVDHKVRALREGADDYMVKPFAPTELLARVDALLRRSQGPSKVTRVYTDPELMIHFDQHRVVCRGEEKELSPKEFRILCALIENAGSVLSQEVLIDKCWELGEGSEESVRTYIRYLRRKLEVDPTQPRLIKTVKDFGYQYLPAAKTP